MSKSVQELEGTVSEAIRGVPLSRDIETVKVEPDTDAEGNQILRVLIQMKRHRDDSDAELEKLLEDIETAILAIDDRYPSVRFLDAA